MRHAIRKIRDEFGADAVNLSNRNTRAGVEVTAAIDYDDAEAAADEQALAGAHESEAPSAWERRVDAYAAALPEQATPTPPPLPSWAHGAGQAPESADESAPRLQTLSEEVTSLRALLEHQLSSLAWSELERRQPVKASVVTQLMDLGIRRPFAESIVGDSAVNMGRTAIDQFGND